MLLVEFDDDEGGSSSDEMDEYKSDDELGDMFCSPRSGGAGSAQKHKRPTQQQQQQAKTTSLAPSKPHAKPRCKATALATAITSTEPTKPAAVAATGSKFRLNKPPTVASKPVKSSIMKPFSANSVEEPTRSIEGSEDVGSFLGMKEYMDAMDRELARTTVGKSFIREGDEVWTFTYFIDHFMGRLAIGTFVQLSVHQSVIFRCLTWKQ